MGLFKKALGGCLRGEVPTFPFARIIGNQVRRVFLSPEDTEHP